MQYIVYDCEIKYAIPSNGTRINGVSYCAGWEDFPNMGIACICAYESKYDRYRVFCRDNLDHFAEMLREPAMIVGYNSISFDDRLCCANGYRPVTGYDILREFYRAKGLNPWPEKYTDEYKGISLDAVAKANLPIRKTMSGAMAPVLWQQGYYGQVIDYCLQDVHITKCLFEMILKGIPLKCPKTQTPVLLRNPEKETAAEGK